MKGNVLIVGARSDMAQAVARKYAQEGYALTLAARGTEGMDSQCGDLRVRYPQAEVRSVELDVLATDTHGQFCDALDPLPDVVICAAGYLGDQELAQTDMNEFRKITDTNYTGCASVLGTIANKFMARGSGVIIGISSVAGDRGRKSNYVYGSAKAAFTSYLSGLRHRMVDAGIKVITVKPGFVRTRMTEGMPLPGALTAMPDEVALDIFNAHQKGRDEIYTKWFWRYIMLIIRHLPEFIFKRTNL